MWKRRDRSSANYRRRISAYLWDPQQCSGSINCSELNGDLDNELDKIMKEFTYDKFDLLERMKRRSNSWYVIYRKGASDQTEIAHKKRLQQLLQNNPWVI